MKTFLAALPWETEFPLDLDLIDHIEVVRGAGSSLFGTNAIFGVINVITRNPTGESAIEVSGDTASFLGRNGRVTGSQGVSTAVLVHCTCSFLNMRVRK